MTHFIEWLKRKKRKRKCKVHFDGDSFQIKDYTVAPVHQITENITYLQAFDFYISTEYDTYLLCLTNGNESCGMIYPAKNNSVIYIASKLPFNKATMNDSIDKTLNALREGYNFPKLKNPTVPMKFSIDKKC